MSDFSHSRETQIPRFISIAEFVAATKVSRQTVNRKLKTGEIPSRNLGSRILIPVSYLFSLEKEAWAGKKCTDSSDN